MSPLVEALVLPCLFLTVVLAGSIRPGGDVTMVPPSLASLVLAVVLMSILARSGALAPERLAGPSRTPLQNVSGLIVLLAAFAASAQVVTLVLPESGVPELIGWVVLISLLLQTLAIAPDRARVRRGLAVTFGAAFVLKFVVLSALSSPAEGGLARALQLVFDGVTLGSVTQRRSTRPRATSRSGRWSSTSWAWPCCRVRLPTERLVTGGQRAAARSTTV